MATNKESGLDAHFGRRSVPVSFFENVALPRMETRFEGGSNNFRNTAGESAKVASQRSGAALRLSGEPELAGKAFLGSRYSLVEIVKGFLLMIPLIAGLAVVGFGIETFVPDLLHLEQWLTLFGV